MFGLEGNIVLGSAGGESGAALGRDAPARGVDCGAEGKRVERTLGGPGEGDRTELCQYRRRLVVGEPHEARGILDLDIEFGVDRRLVAQPAQRTG